MSSASVRSIRSTRATWANSRWPGRGACRLAPMKQRRSSTRVSCTWSIPVAASIAINATNGDLIWEYERQYPKEMADFVGGPERARSKGLAIYEDMIYFLAHDGAIVALDARTGKERWVN